ncbi:MAG: DUF4397 domain-containing protein, partial [Jatrophihabitantaceae bacterium]
MGTGLMPAGAAAAPAAAASEGQLYILQGLPGRNVDLYVNDQRVGSDIAAKSVVGPMSLAAGSYDLRVTD